MSEHLVRNMAALVALALLHAGIIALAGCHRSAEYGTEAAPARPQLTWLCIKIDDVPSALGLEPSGEGSVSFGAPGDDPHHLVTVHLCSEREAKTLFVVPSGSAKPSPPASSDRK